jgi:hypothetical protein
MPLQSESESAVIKRSLVLLGPWWTDGQDSSSLAVCFSFYLGSRRVEGVGQLKCMAHHPE